MPRHQVQSHDTGTCGAHDSEPRGLLWDRTQEDVRLETERRGQCVHSDRGPRQDRYGLTQGFKEQQLALTAHFLRYTAQMPCGAPLVAATYYTCSILGLMHATCSLCSPSVPFVAPCSSGSLYLFVSGTFLLKGTLSQAPKSHHTVDSAIPGDQLMWHRVLPVWSRL